MKSQLRGQIVEIYKNTVDSNLKDIREKLKELGIYNDQVYGVYKKYLSKSLQTVIKKWENGNKYLRTELVASLFKSEYPQDHDMLRTSIIIDVMINLLDDLYDEPLERKELKGYLFEYFRTYAVYNLTDELGSAGKMMGKYFNKIITLALAERIYITSVKGEKDLNKYVQATAQVVETRGMDIDIFAELTLKAYLDKKSINVSDEMRELVLKLCRYYRGLNIFKKDIKDIDHDMSTGQETLVTLAYSQDFSFEDYKGQVTKVLEAKVDKLLNDMNLDMRDTELEKLVSNIVAGLKAEQEALNKLN